MNRSTNPDRIGMWEYTDAVNRMKLSPLITRFGVNKCYVYSKVESVETELSFQVTI